MSSGPICPWVASLPCARLAMTAGGMRRGLAMTVVREAPDPLPRPKIFRELRDCRQHRLRRQPTHRAERAVAHHLCPGRLSAPDWRPERPRPAMIFSTVSLARAPRRRGKGVHFPQLSMAQKSKAKRAISGPCRCRVVEHHDARHAPASARLRQPTPRRSIGKVELPRAGVGPQRPADLHRLGAARPVRRAAAITSSTNSRTVTPNGSSTNPPQCDVAGQLERLGAGGAAFAEAFVPLRPLRQDQPARWPGSARC